MRLSRRGLFGFVSAAVLAPMAFVKSDLSMKSFGTAPLLEEGLSVTYDYKSYGMGYVITKDVLADFYDSDVNRVTYV